MGITDETELVQLVLAASDRVSKVRLEIEESRLFPIDSLLITDDSDDALGRVHGARTVRELDPGKIALTAVHVIHDLVEFPPAHSRTETGVLRFFEQVEFPPFCPKNYHSDPKVSKIKGNKKSPLMLSRGFLVRNPEVD